jgi:hypothetical protein
MSYSSNTSGLHYLVLLVVLVLAVLHLQSSNLTLGGDLLTVLVGGMRMEDLMHKIHSLPKIKMKKLTTSTSGILNQNHIVPQPILVCRNSNS